MGNKEKAIKRELTRLRRTQNPEQIDFRRMRQRRVAKTKLQVLKRKSTVGPAKVVSTEKKKEKKKSKPKKKPKTKEPELEIIDESELEEIEEEPELEEIEEEPELEVIEEEPKPKKKKKEPELEVIEEEPELEEVSLEDLYTYDEDIDEEDFEEE
ncbi:MAG: hypothetical protein ACFFEK_13660 [Candidatus Thorarchaeota archaeon]